MLVYELIMEVERQERERKLERHWRHLPPRGETTERRRLTEHLMTFLRRCVEPLSERTRNRPAL
jgi:hypothetical protein